MSMVGQMTNDEEYARGVHAALCDLESIDVESEHYQRGYLETMQDAIDDWAERATDEETEQDV